MKWTVHYYYLASGMEGRPDVREWPDIDAPSAQDACYVVANNFYRRDTYDWQFMMGCLTAEEQT